MQSLNSRPRGENASNAPNNFQETTCPGEISQAWTDFQKTEQKAEDLQVLAKKCMEAVKVGYLSPYIRDIRLKKEASLLDDGVKSILVVPPPGSPNGGKFE